MQEDIRDDQTRRHFCKLVTLAACTSALIPIAGCASPTSPSNVTALPVLTGTRGPTGVVVSIVAGSPLDNVGGAALVRAGVSDLLVMHIAADQFVALNAICTHQTCTINGIHNQQFVCPCHGSTFDSSGRVLGGPAPAPLRSYPTQYLGGSLTISA